jgi:hypothetical protein
MPKKDVMSKRRSPIAACRKGATAAEFALLLPVLMLLFSAIIQYGTLMFTYNTMISAARSGARAASIAGVAEADVETTVRNMLPGWVSPGAVEVVSTPTNDGLGVRVVVTVPSETATVLRYGPMPATISASVEMARALAS